ncbi:unnamed protein product [Didymodactylos carnosus]|uniref:DNA topoisomerase 2 n=1 Tax=Didymodactylos carnosus TaxID=1234261 RepID=A0A8S2CK52_9BILA|nr:unnamed protein product [Didymodactylos carnosus]CAF3496279.1 unnamed protein product [Didymodactylos carnosus]
MLVTVSRAGTSYVAKFGDGGKVLEPLHEKGPAHGSGTTVHFLPDARIFKTLRFNPDLIRERIRESSFLFKKLKIVFTDNQHNTRDEFISERGIAQFVEFINDGRKALSSVCQITGKESDIEVEVALQYTDEVNETSVSFANSVKTPEGGTHLTGFRTALTEAVNAYARSQGALKEKEANFDGDDVREGLTAVVAVKIPERLIQYEGQTKNKLFTQEARSAIKQARLAAEAAKKAREEVRKLKGAKKERLLSGKLTPAQHKNKARNELFLVEGDSAGGSAKLGRDRVYQAILPLRGKVINVERARLIDLLANEEIATMIAAIGAGIGKDFDLSAANYAKVIIMTDADTDGAHIQTLLLTFFYRFMRPLIEQAYIGRGLDEMIADRYGRYAKYIIQERALPDIRDGLKPVQRRILFAMHELGLINSRPYKKSARAVGEVIGKYHPHDMHGNKGSIDGDPAAAMRYTESRLSLAADLMLSGIEKGIVPFALNFDDSEKEPTVLPARIPNLLVNGATGIAAGYATNMPPHNLNEVVDALILRIDSPNSRLESILNALKGPDFPTGGVIQGIEGIRQAYETGKGKIALRAKIEQVEGPQKALIITEIPFEVAKGNLVKQIDEIRLEQKIPGIQEVRDESDRTGLRIVIELEKQASFATVPKARFEIVEGLIKAIKVLDEVIATIRKAQDRSAAKQALQLRFGFSELQADAIVMLRLYRLSSTDITLLTQEKEQLAAQITADEALLASDELQRNALKQSLRAAKKLHGVARRSIIEEQIEELKVTENETIAEEPVFVLVTRDGYVKRMSPRAYFANDYNQLSIKQGDLPIATLSGTTLDRLILLTDRAEQVPVQGLKAGGVKALNLEENDRLAGLVSLDDEGQHVLICANRGMKRIG